MKNSDVLKKLKDLRQNLDDLQDHFENTKTDEKLEIAISALKLVRDFDEDQEDEYGDPGELAKSYLKKINNL